MCECPHELDVRVAAATGRWPDRADGELRAHVARCPACADVAEIAPLFVDDRDAAWQQADVPPASAVWWRAQMRGRREAAEQAARPMVLVQRAALAYAGATLFALGVLLGPWIVAWLHVARNVLERLAPSQVTLEEIASLMNAGLLPVVAVTVCLLLTPVVLYFALGDR